MFDLARKAWERPPMSRLRTRVFQSWFRISRPMTLGVRGLIVREDGRILLIRHTYTEGWFFPGGGVEKAEPALEALRRELVEEAGVHLESRPDLIGFFSNHTAFPNDHVLLYQVMQWRQGEATSQGEIAESRWVDPADPPEGVTPGTARRLSEFLTGAPAGDFW